MAGRCVIGVDLGGTKVLAGAVDEGLDVHHRAQRKAAGLDQAALLDTIVAAVEEARSEAGREVDAVGFGIPCLIDQSRGMAVTAAHLPIVDLPFRDIMAERLGLPVFVDNDGNVAALAEHRYGAGRGFDHVVMMTVGTGVGGGLVLGGELYRGTLGAAAELGHMVIEMDGPPCPGNCPSFGCLEALASGTALVAEARRVARDAPHTGLGRAHAAGREITGPMVTELAFDGDQAARDVIALIGQRLGIGIVNCVNIFNPDVVVIGGGVVAAGDMLLEPARAIVAQRALRPSRDDVRIVPARFAHEAGMIGAAALAFDGLHAGPQPAGQA